MSIEQLNTDYGIAGQLKFVEGKGGFPVIEIENTMARALISVYGGQVLSFQPVTEPEDLMFLSEKAYYQTGKAIKGGIPLCWPWFGSDPENLGRSSHGFARNNFWTVLATEVTPGRETKVKLGLVDTAETREIWSQAFNLTLEITVGNTLTLELVTRNTGDKAFSITQAFHTYFKVGDIDQVKVLGLTNTKYLDKVDNFEEKHQQGAVTIAEEVDRIYTDVPQELVIEDASFPRRIKITSDGNKTAVVWNPWADISAKMKDLDAEDYKRFICVETANAAKDVIEISPNSEYRLLVNYGIEQS
ncbi:MAG: D-hexose-6-phosphate mutarotase [Xenococcaceae cyanobacterium MO_188.B32]|nr:D-hexose-6-phosphate mutarotase [Xenococcaceae cyanobacterium MO_188.B32]